MSSFNNNGVTLKGAVIIASLVAGQTLTFTRMAVGDGALPSGQTPFSTEKMINPLFDVPILSVESDSVAHATVKGVFSNADLDTGFYYRELGLYAINPVTKAEELFCYGNAGDDAEWINAVGESSLIEKEIHLVTLIGNATVVTANFDEKTLVLKSEYDDAMKLKADLDAEGGRVVASQMRFDKAQTLYVNASAAAGGDGTIDKPFRTIQAAIDARYLGCDHIYVYVYPGVYDEDVVIGDSSGASWNISNNSADAVSLKSIYVNICDHLSISGLTFTENATISNVTDAYLTDNTFNGDGSNIALNISSSRAFLDGNTINYATIGVNVSSNAHVHMKSMSGVGNVIGINASESLVLGTDNAMKAATEYVRLNGAIIALEGGRSSCPSNYSQLYDLGIFETIDAIKAAVLSEFEKLKLNESRMCSFDTLEIFGPFSANQQIRCDITRTSLNNSGIVMMYAHDTDTAAAILRIENGIINTPVPLIDKKTLYRIADYRISSTAYALGDIVGVPYHADLLMKCMAAGTTSGDALDTSGVKEGDIITDGTVVWRVEQVGATYAVVGDTIDRDADAPTYGLG